MTMMSRSSRPRSTGCSATTSTRRPATASARRSAACEASPASAPHSSDSGPAPTPSPPRAAHSAGQRRGEAQRTLAAASLVRHLPGQASLHPGGAAGRGRPVAVVKPSRKYRGGFAVSFTVTPHGVPSRTVRVEFARAARRCRESSPTGRRSPRTVMRTALCACGTPVTRSTCSGLRRDGAAALIGCIALHLIREQWWRETGEWPGPEAPHPVPQTRPQRTAA